MNTEYVKKLKDENKRLKMAMDGFMRYFAVLVKREGTVEISEKELLDCVKPVIEQTAYKDKLIFKFIQGERNEGIRKH